MPTYEYRCTKPNCGREFEVNARMNDPKPSRADGCTEGACQLEKKLTSFSGFVKGAGASKESAKVRESDRSLLASESKRAPAAAYFGSQPASAEHVCGKYCQLHGQKK